MPVSSRAGGQQEDEEEGGGGFLFAPPGSMGWFGATFSSLSIPTYRLIWFLTVGSLTGVFIMITAQGLLAYELAGNNRAVGFVTSGQGVAMLLLNPVGGAIADRVNKRALFVATNATLTTSIAVIAVLTLTDHISIVALTANSFIGGAMFALIVPSRVAYIGELVPEPQRGNAVALTQVGTNGARIVGPLLGAALLSWEALGFGGVYLVVTACYSFIALLCLRLPPAPPAPARRAGVLDDIRLGLLHVRERPRLPPLLVGFVAILAISQTFMTVLPGFTKDVLGTGNEGFGLAVGAAAIGGLSAGLVVATIADSPRADALLHFGSFGLGLTMIALGAAPSLAIMLVVIVFVGGFTSWFQILDSSLAFRETAPEYFGRVQSLMMIAFSLAAVAALPTGWLADLIGERSVLYLIGLAVCIVGAIMLVWLSALGRRR